MMPTQDQSEWMASQYHRPDLDEGLILAFRRQDSRFAAVQVTLHGLDRTKNYVLTFDTAGKTVTMSGSDLMSVIKGLEIVVPDNPGSELVTYKKSE
jgi:alpha-galactosidase